MSNTDALTDDPLTLKKLVRSLWSLQVYALLGAIIAILAGVGVIAALRISLPVHQAAHAAVALTFEGVDRAEYPNGRPFSVRDLVAPIILDAVFERNKLADYGLDRATFGAAISVDSYAILYDEIVGRYQSRLGNRKLSFAEQQQIEQELRSELQRSFSKHALIGFSSNSRFGLPRDLLAKLLNDIPAIWSEYAIKNLGVLTLPEALVTDDVIDFELLKPAGPAVALDMLQTSIGRLRDRIVELSNSKGSKTIRDGESGLTVDGLIRSVADISKFRLVPLVASIRISGRTLADDAQDRAYLTQRLLSLRMEEVRLNQRLKSSREIVDSYFKDALVKIAPIDAGAPKEAPSANVNQINEGAIDAVARLTREALDLEFRRTMIGRNLDDIRDIDHVTAELRRLEELQTALQETTSDTTATLPQSREQFSQRVTVLAQDLNKLWRITTRLFATVAVERYSYSSRLFQPIDIKSDLEYRASHPIDNPMVYGLLAACAILGALLGMFLGFVRLALK
ncbi:MAG: hypothetical protein AB7E80_16555 [Hyphomicrobiaceae bacterium]